MLIKWNGPLGVFDQHPGEEGQARLAMLPVYVHFVCWVDSIGIQGILCILA